MSKHQIKSISDFIWQKPNDLDADFCKHVIQKFESDSRKHVGIVGDDCIVDSTTKQSIDLPITALEEWKEEDDVFHNSLQMGLKDYISYLGQFHEDLKFPPEALSDTGYQIQKTNPGGFYTWHFDEHAENSRLRVVTFIWYLNDVHEDGYTEFVDGTKVQPEEGKLLIFPSAWNFLHRGYPPKSEEKYIVTGWVYSQYPPPGYVNSPNLQYIEKNNLSNP